MKYALISDIHGNYPALMAALADARALGVDEFVFLGDYFLSLLFPNDVIDEIARAAGVKIRGNQEGYLTKLHARDKSTWTDGQFRALYWCYRAITPENHAYLDALPETAKIITCGAPIHAAHTSYACLGDAECGLFTPERAINQYMHTKDAFAQMRIDICENIAHDDMCLKRIRALDAGVYAFGHTHRQWYGWFEGRLFVNPGACGLPLDYKSGAPYTILDITPDHICVIERRAQYDVYALARALRASDMYAAAPVWYENAIDELLTHRTQVELVFENAEKYARATGDHERPYTIETWMRAFESWHPHKRPLG